MGGLIKRAVTNLGELVVDRSAITLTSLPLPLLLQPPGPMTSSTWGR